MLKKQLVIAFGLLLIALTESSVATCRGDFEGLTNYPGLYNGCYVRDVTIFQDDTSGECTASCTYDGEIGAKNGICTWSTGQMHTTMECN